MRLALVVAVTVHALIHVMGFVRWFRLAELPAMSGPTLFRLSSGAAKAYGVLWLVAFVVLLAAAVAIARRESWWTLALGGALLSQSLIIIAWSDAKFGSIGNLLILVALAMSAARTRFDQRVDAEVRALLSRDAGVSASIVRAEDLRHLPPPVFLPISGRDVYAAGSGHMLIKAASLLSIVDSRDEKIAQSAMLRFLGETVWFPSAALSPYLQWEFVDARRARVTMRHGGVVASAVFTFDEHGRSRPWMQSATWVAGPKPSSRPGRWCARSGRRSAGFRSRPAATFAGVRPPASSATTAGRSSTWSTTAPSCTAKPTFERTARS